MVGLRFLVIVSVLSFTCVVRAALDPSEFGPKINEIIATVHSACISQSGTDDTTVNNIIKGIFNEEPKIKAYMTCLLTSTKVIDEKGVFFYEKVADLAPVKYKEQSVTNVKNCGTKVNDIANMEDRAFEFFKCFYHANPDLFIFF